MPDGWPPALPGLGPRVLGPYRPCAVCAESPDSYTETVTFLADTPDETTVSWEVEVIEHTWVAYGGRPLCLPHVKASLAKLLVRHVAPFGPAHWDLVGWPRTPADPLEVWAHRPIGMKPLVSRPEDGFIRPPDDD